MPIIYRWETVRWLHSSERPEPAYLHGSNSMTGAWSCGTSRPGSSFNAMDAGLTQKDLRSYAVTISTPERAIMEVMYGLPRDASFEEVALLMEGLTTLRPRMLQVLLEQCHSVKVKRLFMYLAEDCNHAWVKKLDVSKVDFGKGKRMLVKGGRFNAKYSITVPLTEPA